jgi:hypothetical protein
MSIRLSRFARSLSSCCGLALAAAAMPAHAQKVRALPPTPAPNTAAQALPNAAGLPSSMPFPAGLPPPPVVGAAPASEPVIIGPSGFEVAPAGRYPGTAYSRAQESPAPVAQRGPYTALQIAQSFLGADANRDGELTRAEAQRLTLMPFSFEEMDRNHDGILTRSEYEDALR